MSQSTPGYYRYLLPAEVQIASVRQHAFFLVQSLAAAIGGLLAAVVVGVVTGPGSTPAIIGWVLTGLLLGRGAIVTLSWSVRYMVLTSDRLFLLSGLLKRRVKVIPYAAFMEMSFSRSFAGRMLGFGTYTVEAGGRPVLIMDYIPYSEQLLLLLSGQIYPHAADNDDIDVYEDDDDDEPPGRARRSLDAPDGLAGRDPYLFLRELMDPPPAVPPVPGPPPAVLPEPDEPDGDSSSAQ
jgi:Bacterial PH domain